MFSQEPLKYNKLTSVEHVHGSSISTALSSDRQTNFVAMPPSDYDRHTAQLERLSYNHRVMWNFLKTYQEMGDRSFHKDLRSFLKFPQDAFDDADRGRLINIIEDIRNDQESYNQIRHEIVNSIREIESNARMPVNAFARSLYVNELRGKGFFERYVEDVHYALEELTIEMEEMGLIPRNLTIIH